MTYLITKFPQVFLTQLHNISKQVFAFSSTIYIFIFIFNVNCPCFMYFTIIEQTFQWHYFHSCVNKVHIVSIKLDYSFCFSLKNGNVYYFEFHVKSYKGLTDVSVMVRRHYYNVLIMISVLWQWKLPSHTEFEIVSHSYIALAVKC